MERGAYTLSSYHIHPGGVVRSNERGRRPFARWNYCTENKNEKEGEENNALSSNTTIRFVLWIPLE